MKILLSLLFALTLIITQAVPRTTLAQETREQRVDRELAIWKDSLRLTDSQVAKVQALMLQQDDEAVRDRAVLESWLAQHPNATEEEEAALQQSYATHMLAYDPLYDAYLEPWQRDIVIRIDLYHSHRRYLRDLWWRWWWWPWRLGPHWPPHHHGPHWPPRVYPPHHPPPAPPPPPIPPRPRLDDRRREPSPRTMPPPRSTPQPRTNPQPRTEQPRQQPQPRTEQPRTEQPRQQPAQQPQQPRQQPQPSQPSQPQQPQQPSRPQRPAR